MAVTLEEQAADDPAAGGLPATARVSTPRGQLRIWTLANLGPAAWIAGALGVQLGIGLWLTLFILLGVTALGCAAHGLFGVISVRTGAAQMALSRLAFGAGGAKVPAVLQLLNALGWSIVTALIIGGLVADQFTVFEGMSSIIKPIVAVALALVTAAIAAVGFTELDRVARIVAPIVVITFVAATIVALATTPVDWSSPPTVHGWPLVVAFLAALSAVGAGWMYGWITYVGDEARFLPADLPTLRAAWAPGLGIWLAAPWLGVLGALLATTGEVDPLAILSRHAGWLVLPGVIAIVAQALIANVINVYSASLAARVIGIPLSRRATAAVVTLVCLPIIIIAAVRGSQMDAFVAILQFGIVAFGPYVAIVAIDWRLRRGRFSQDELVGRSGISPWPALIAMLIGVLAGWCFLDSAYAILRGPGSRALDGADLAWLIGPLVAGVTYVLLRQSRRFG